VWPTVWLSLDCHSFMAAKCTDQSAKWAGLITDSDFVKSINLYDKL